MRRGWGGHDAAEAIAGCLLLAIPVAICGAAVSAAVRARQPHIWGIPFFYWYQAIVFCVIFLLLTCVGFLAARWRRADLGHLNEWGLAGRKFGTWLAWFLIGGDIHTA